MAAITGLTTPPTFVPVVADYYAGQNKYASVDGVGTMDEVFDRIAAVIDALK